MNPNLDLDTTIARAQELVGRLHRAHSAAVVKAPTAALLLLDLIGQARAIEQRLRQLHSALDAEGKYT